MNRLQSELHRLFLASPLPAPGLGFVAGAATAPLIDSQGMTRALVLELARPADWEAIAAVWRGVQADLALPAPAIAVSGVDGYQLWFSLAAPVAVARAHDFLEGLHQRYLPQIAPARVSLMPGLAQPGQPPRHAALVPGPQAHSENWSAFVAPDLAPVFADMPWLDIPPGDEGQADLLRGLARMSPTVFDDALARLRPVAPAPAVRTPVVEAPTTATTTSTDPRRFLLQVMNDPGVDLSLRIEAAKALLPHVDGAGTLLESLRP